MLQEQLERLGLRQQVQLEQRLLVQLAPQGLPEPEPPEQDLVPKELLEQQGLLPPVQQVLQVRLAQP